MVEWSKVYAKLKDTQLKKLRTAVKNKTGANLRKNFKNVWWKRSTPWVITDIKTKKKLRNALNNNMSTDLKLYKAQTSKIMHRIG